MRRNETPHKFSAYATAYPTS